MLKRASSQNVKNKYIALYFESISLGCPMDLNGFGTHKKKRNSLFSGCTTLHYLISVHVGISIHPGICFLN